MAPCEALRQEVPMKFDVPDGISACILPLSAGRESLPPGTREAIGGKAFELARLRGAGFPVPDGFALSWEFFGPWRSQIEACGAWRLLSETDGGNREAGGGEALEAALGQALSSLRLDAERKELLSEAVQEFGLRDGQHGGLLAVRSSSSDEDGQGASFAGGYETVLGVHARDLEEAVRACFASAYGPRARAYRRRQGLASAHPRIAVLVQGLVEADQAGVAFSIDPVSNCYDEAVVSAARGLGEKVVQGMVETDVFTLDKVSGRLVSQKASGSDPCLSQGQLKALLDLVKAVEADFGRPVDIEWAFQGDALFLLQARPVTAWLPLPPEMLTKPGEPRKLYANATLIEQGVEGSLSALGADFLNLVLKSMAGSLGEGGVGLDGTTFTAGGRYYTHVSNAVRLGGRKMAFAPGSMGDETVSAILDSIDLEQYLPRELPSALKKMKRKMPLLLLTIGMPTLRALFNPEGLLAEFRRESPAQEAAFFNPEREGESLAQRAEYLAGLLDFYNLRFGTPFVLASQLAYRKIQALFKSEGEAARSDIARLAQALPGNPTAQLGVRMQSLAQAPEIQGSQTEEEFLARLSDRRFGEAFMAEWNGFIREFGHRAPREIDAATPRAAEDPGILFRRLKALPAPRSSGGVSVSGGESGRDKAAERLAALARAVGGRRKEMKFQRAYETWVRYGGFREMPKHYIVRAVAEFRKAALARAAGLVAQGRLDAPEDIFRLSIEDVDRAAGDPDFDLRAAGVARMEHAEAADRSGRIVRLIDSRGRIFYPPARRGAPGELPGVPISPGLARGRVKILRSPDEKVVEPGDILVARAADPGWTPLFLHVSAVVLEIGGVLQHAAIVAREYGLPCVSGISGATELLKDGQLVEVDGSSSMVRILGPEDGGRDDGVRASATVSPEGDGNARPPENPGWRKKFLRLYAGQAFSLLSSNAVQFALIWWITVQSGSAIALALASIAGLAPQIVIGPFAGVWVDRFDRKKVMILADGAVALASAGLAFCFAIGWQSLPLVYVALFLRALGETFHKPALQAALPGLVPPSELTRAGGLGQAVNQLSSMVGPMVGALLIEFFPMPLVLAVDILGAALAVWALSGLRFGSVPQSGRSLSFRSLLEDMRYAFRLIAANKGVVAASLPVLLTSFLFMPLGSLIPLMVKEHFLGTAWQTGLARSLFSTGMLVSAVFIGVFGKGVKPFAAIALSTLFLGFFSFIAGSLPPQAFSLYCASVFLLGASGMWGSVPYMALVQRTIPREHLGKVLSLLTSLIGAGIPLGMAVAGPASELLGVGPWMRIIGVAMALLGLSAFLYYRSNSLFKKD